MTTIVFTPTLYHSLCYKYPDIFNTHSQLDATIVQMAIFVTNEVLAKRIDIARDVVKINDLLNIRFSFYQLIEDLVNDQTWMQYGRPHTVTEVSYCKDVVYSAINAYVHDIIRSIGFTNLVARKIIQIESHSSIGYLHVEFYQSYCTSTNTEHAGTAGLQSPFIPSFTY